MGDREPPILILLYTVYSGASTWGSINNNAFDGRLRNKKTIHNFEVLQEGSHSPLAVLAA